MSPGICIHKVLRVTSSLMKLTRLRIVLTWCVALLLVIFRVAVLLKRRRKSLAQATVLGTTATCSCSFAVVQSGLGSGYLPFELELLTFRLCNRLLSMLTVRTRVSDPSSVPNNKGFIIFLTAFVQQTDEWTLLGLECTTTPPVRGDSARSL